ncbi:ABC transporter permease [Clostridium vitabionis]|jgi:tungstate transport system permease protein|uniref:ABC transporter permease n=1 Tax=Clostridium vitabionis TaxID=2784388 RepID=UPI00188D5C67|nr:ABC transporter permease [Clostridium vitabionis]
MPAGLFDEFFGTVGVLDSIRVTVVMSFWSTLISSVLGISAGLALERHEFPGKRLVVRINRTLMGAPPVVIGLVTYMLLRKKGPFGGLRLVFTIRGMVIAQVLIITPIICGMVYTYARRSAPEIRQFAHIMGADRRQTARLLLSEMKNEIYFAIISGYGRSISEVGAVFLVGGNIKNSTRTMTTAISTLKGAGDYNEGLFLGAVLMLMAFAAQTLADHFRKEAQ